MITDWKYSHEENLTISIRKNENKSTLVAKLRFGDKTSPNDRKTIKNRISFVKDGYNLPEYIFEKEKLALMSTESKHFEGEGKNLDISHSYSLGINLTVTAKGYIPRNEMIDLEALNHFILTGDSNYREKEKIKAVALSKKSS